MEENHPSAGSLLLCVLYKSYDRTLEHGFNSFAVAEHIYLNAAFDFCQAYTSYFGLMLTHTGKQVFLPVS